jgi:molybdopterin-containing oxidoreductase family membrane subunit
MVERKKATASGSSVVMSALAVIALVGLGAWIYELVYGLAVTGMRNVISWGLYIFTFAYFVKLSAGGLIVASTAEVFGVAALKPLMRIGVLTAAICVAVAAMIIIPDMGRPDRLLNIIMYPNFRSPIIWDISIIAVYLTMSVIEFGLLSAPPERQRRLLIKTLAVLGLPAAFALHSITAWIFGVQISRPYWNSALMAPMFVVSAILCGSSLIALIAALLQRFAGFRFESSTWRALATMMAASLAIDLYFVFCEYVTVLWGVVPREMIPYRMLMPDGKFGALTAIEWIVGGVAPFVLLVLPAARARIGYIVTSAILILAGVYAFQIGLINVGEANPLIQLAPGSSLGTFTAGASVFQLVGQYAPTWVEYAILAGLVAFAALAFMIVYRVFGVRTHEQQSSLPAA